MSRARNLLSAARVRTNEAKPKPGDFEEQDGTLYLTGRLGVEIDVERLKAGKLLFGFSERGRNIGSLEMTRRQAQALLDFIK